MIPFQKGGKIPIFGLHLSNKQHIAFVFRLMQVYPLPDYISRNSEQRQRGDDRDFPCPAILKPIIVESGSFPEILLFNHPGRSLQGRTGQRIAVIDEFVDIPRRFLVTSCRYVGLISRIEQHRKVLAVRNSFGAFDVVTGAVGTVAEQLYLGPCTKTRDGRIPVNGLLDSP